jgi:hypothetical protein
LALDAGNHWPDVGGQAVGLLAAVQGAWAVQPAHTLSSRQAIHGRQAAGSVL